MKRYCYLAIILALFIPRTAMADEGMWLVQLIESKLHEKMWEKGLRLSSQAIYDEDSLSLSDAIVALAFGCTGSMISDDGLMITNHHCAYADIHALSTPEKNYLEDGFRAMSREEELPVKSDGIFFLKKVFEVTDEVAHLKDSLQVEGKPFGMRKVFSIMESRYAPRYPGLEISCDSFWGGSRYFLAVYQVYKDVRLVAAPPVCIASYGGEVDNWEWPQHKGDFTIYRIYTAPDGSPAPYSAENVPLHPKKVLPISTTGVSTGDFVMVMGYPGRTDRYASPSAVKHTTEVVNPIQVKYRGEQMKILDKWMNADPVVRLKYADRYFSLTNVQEIREGEIYCYNRFSVPERKVELQNKPLQEWIDADAGRKAEFGTLIADLESKYDATRQIDTQINLYRETVIRCFNVNRIMNGIVRLAEDLDKRGVKRPLADSAEALVFVDKAWQELDMRVERELFDFALGEFYANVDSEYWGDYLKQMYDSCGGDAGKVAADIWDNSIYTDEARFRNTLAETHTADTYKEDPLYKFTRSTGMLAFNKKKSEIEGEQATSKLESAYKKQLYRMRLDKGEVQYPDANSTMRLTYGTVGPIKPRDAVFVDDHSTADGILEKYDPNQYIFSLKPEVKKLFEERAWGGMADPATGKLHVNFLSDNDITGGNSGSPVLDGYGRIVGLAFDGNKEGLAGDTWFEDGMNKCISVDIRYVLFILKNYMGMDYLIDEMKLDGSGKVPSAHLHKGKAPRKPRGQRR